MSRKRTILSQLDEPCEICGKRSDPEILMLCDGCDLAYHTKCLHPPLKKVPVGAWMCSEYVASAVTCC